MTEADDYDELRRRGACNGHPNPGIFFADGAGVKGTAERTKYPPEAYDLCHTCPVKTACFIWAIEHPAETRYGLWAGTTPAERRALRMSRSDAVG